MSAGDLTIVEMLGTIDCPAFCGKQAEVYNIGRFTKAICQNCGSCLPRKMPLSFNGRKPGSQPDNEGSTPSSGAIKDML